MVKKKILIFSPPFSGHLNILKEFINKYHKEFEFKLIITGWNNIKPDLTNLKCRSIIISKYELKYTDPMLWTFERVSKYLDDCIKITKEFEPDLIIYDFFSIEGNLIGKKSNIPYWCSIPAFLEPYSNKKYLQEKFNLPINKKYIQEIKEKFNLIINENDLEMISDGFNLPGEVNLVWSYEELISNDFMKKRNKFRYEFIGRIDRPIPKKLVLNKVHRIYFSLGTVVLNNLWNQQDETRKKLSNFIELLTKKLEGKNIKINFVSQGKKILDNYPKNWKIIDYADQKKMLSQADIFITHGGNNSFNESVLERTPMIVIPFFGDQIAVGKQIEKLGIGINLVNDQSVDTNKEKNFLNEDLAQKLKRSIYKILESNKYQNNINNLKLKNIDIEKLIKNEI